MQSKLIFHIFTFLVICLFPSLLSAEPQLTVQLDRTALYEGESFHYQLVLSDSSPISAHVTPDTSAWTEFFDVQLLDKQTGQRGGIQSSFTMIVNGQTIRDEQKTSTATYITQFSYALTPKRAGSLSIALPQVTVNGKVLSPQSFSVEEGERRIAANHSVAVRVWEPDDQDIVFMAIETNRTRLYPLQPLEVTLTVQIKGLPGRYAEVNPLTLPQQPPQLQIPWAVEDVPRGLQSDQKLEDWLNGYLVRTPQRGSPGSGFGINNYVGKPGFDNDMFLPFSFSAQRQPLRFSNTPQQIIRFDAQGNETVYWEYRFSRTLIPQEFGNYFFGPVTLKGILPVADATGREEAVAQRIFAVAQPVSVAVVDIPQANRPADYIGAFGSFRWETNLTPQQARVGDPMTLTLRLLGEGSTVNVRPMDLSVNSDVADSFRVHMPPTETVDERSCTFTYTIRSTKSGTLSFPPISVSVFDVNTEKFVTLQSLPIPLVIAESETIQSATLFGNVASDGDAQSVVRGLFANKTTFEQVLPPITFVQWAFVVSLLGGGYVVIALGALLFRCQWTSPQRRRQRGALSRAKSRLAEISSALEQRETANLIDISSELQGVFFGYIADKMDGTEQGMTTSDVCQHLLENRVPESLVDAIRAVLEALDGVKYGGMDIRSLDELANTAVTLLRQLERA